MSILIQWSRVTSRQDTAVKQKTNPAMKEKRKQKKTIKTVLEKKW